MNFTGKSSFFKKFWTKKLPSVLPPSICFVLRPVSTEAADEIAFWVGPRKDGIVQTLTTTPFPLHPNYYHLLDEETSPFLPIPVQYEPSNNSRTWFSTRTAEFRRLLESQATGPIPNAQRLAHPWKIRKQEQNRQHKQHIDGILDAQLAYINNPDTSVKPTLYLCMNNIFPA